jgi:hypothetical protein
MVQSVATHFDIGFAISDPPRENDPSVPRTGSINLNHYKTFQSEYNINISSSDIPGVFDMLPKKMLDNTH